MLQIPKALRALILIFIFVWIAHGAVVNILVDWLWFDTVGYLEVFQTRLFAQIALWCASVAIVVAFIGANIRMVFKNQPLDYERLSMSMSELEVRPERIRNVVRALLALWLIMPALFFGAVTQAHWLEFLAWRNQVPFEITESVWGNDISFYVFSLPIYRLAHGLGVALLMVTILPVVLLYIGRDVFVLRATPRLTAGARAHLMTLLGLLFVMFGLGWWLDRFDLLTSHSGVVWGASYTDLNARVPGYWCMMAAAFLVATIFFVGAKSGPSRRPAVAVGAYFVFRIVISSLWPTIVQDYLVKPNEFERERDFIQQNIAATRAAYGIDDIEVRDFPASGTLSHEDIENNPETINNLRIWDPRPLLTTYGQLQEIRTYYEMVGVDVDRYTIGGELRQVMLSPRELDYDNLPGTAQSWVNEHIFYTHGYGLTMSPVNEVSGSGLPGLFLQSIPPEVTETRGTQLDEADRELLRIDEPGIYYGELSNDYVLVRTSEREIDYADEQENVYTTYDGAGGVEVGGLARQFLFSMYFQDVDLLLSQYIQPESRILFRRQIVERVRTLAPFLQLDGDPYVVLSEGRMVFMLDAYTTSSAYPYSEPTQLEGRSSINYVRNSVKVVVDAYDGSVDFYVNDESDPLIRVYQNIFPNAFQPLENMPEDLRSHIRYPSDLFDIQANTYRKYHMIDPMVFYNMEDMWEVPRELYDGQEQPVESYYLIMKLPPDPDATEPEEAKFILLLPFNPVGKPNMTAWMAADCDYGDGYGDLVLYRFNRGDFYNGPLQIEAQIDQDVEISEQITLWNQSGSRVVRGNLLVVPIEDSLIYVEPLYLQAEQSQMPELKRVIVFYGDPGQPEEARVVMRRTLDEALAEIFPAPTEEADATTSLLPLPDEPEHDDEEQVEEAPEQVSASTEVSTRQGTLEDANQIYGEAVSAQRQGDWALYGEKLTELGELLEALAEESDQVDAETESTNDDGSNSVESDSEPEADSE